jgi:hypothetical protein
MDENFGFSGNIPEGASIQNNIEEGLAYQKDHSMYETIVWFRKHVQGGGIWDYKLLEVYDKNGDRVSYEHFGNFHYGVLGRALGISEYSLLAAAGVAHQMDNDERDMYSAGALAFLQFLDHGDDPRDQAQIKAGINAAEAGGYASDKITIGNIIDYILGHTGGLGYNKEQFNRVLDAYRAFDSAFGNTVNPTELAYSAYLQIREKLEEIGKSLYGESWTPEDYGVNKDTIDRYNYNTWPQALFDAFWEWFFNGEEHGLTHEDFDEFWKSEYCPPDLREPADDSEGDDSGDDGDEGGDEGGEEEDEDDEDEEEEDDDDDEDEDEDDDDDDKGGGNGWPRPGGPNGEGPDGRGGRGDGMGGDGDGHGGADDIPPPHRDPIIVDLNKNGKIDAAAKTYFDLDNNGFKESTAWASNGDGILVMDRNGDGIINNGTEVFGDGTLLADGSLASNGFEALNELDSDGNGVINAEDAAYGDMRVWVDANGDGISTEDELISLQDAGVQSINLSAETNGSMDENGNVIARTGTIEWEDGTAGLIAEMLLDADHMRNKPVNSVEVPADILALPELLGGGLMYDFRQAAAMDESGRLKSLMESFIVSDDEETRKEILEEMVFVWSGVEDIVPNSRGNFIDARELGVLEQYSARPFVGTEGTNPHENAAPVLKKPTKHLWGTSIGCC